MPIVSASDWRRAQQQPIELHLPSGVDVMVRRPPLQVWISAGKLPETLVQLMVQRDADPNVTLSPDQLRQMFKFMRDVIVATVVQPRIVDPPTNDDEIGPDDIPLDDANYIFKWAMQGETVKPQGGAGAGTVLDASDLRSFRSF